MELISYEAISIKYLGVSLFLS